MQAIAMDSSTQVSTRKKRAAPLDPQVADRLLDLLSTDDAFRRLFTRDPQEALEQVGFVNVTEAPSPKICFWGITGLATKAQIAEARMEIRSMLTGGLSQQTPKLDTGLNTGRRTLK